MNAMSRETLLVFLAFLLSASLTVTLAVDNEPPQCPPAGTSTDDEGDDQPPCVAPIVPEPTEGDEPVAPSSDGDTTFLTGTLWQHVVKFMRVKCNRAEKLHRPRWSALVTSKAYTTHLGRDFDRPIAFAVRFSSVHFGSLWSHPRSKSLRFTSVQYGVC